MSFDGLAIAALASELRRTLIGARIQKIVQPDPLTFAFEAYGDHRRSWLVLSAEPQRPGAYLASAKPGRGVENPSPLLLLLRKHVDGLRFVEIDQPPGERILTFELVGGPRDDLRAPGEPTAEQSVRFRLIIEAIGQYSNLILVDSQGLILDAARRVTSGQNRVRTTLPRHPYLPPPDQGKRSLREVDADACRKALDQAGSGAFVWQSLVSYFAGLGPLAGREIAFRALGDARARIPADDDALAEVARNLARDASAIIDPVWSGTFQAAVVRSGGASASADKPTADQPREAESSVIVAFAPYPLTHLGGWEPMPSLSAAAEAFFGQKQGVTGIAIARSAIGAAIALERSVVDRKRESLQRAIERSVDVEELRQRGEALLTYCAVIPRGASSYNADGLTLELDPRLTAVENAQACFRRYRKAKSALREVPALLDEVVLRLRYLDEVAAMVGLADTAAAVRDLRAEIRPRGDRPERPTRRRAARRPEAAILRLRGTDNSEILVGRSAQQNQAVTFDLGRPDDVWLHARGCPGAHVILRSDGASASPLALREAAAIAAYYSTNRDAGKVTVDWTTRKQVRRIAKGMPGLVSYSGEQSLVVRPSPRPEQESD